MFEELFSPGRKHTQDEANRLELTRVDVADGDPGRGPIDLESGTVVVRLPDHAPEAAPDHAPESVPEPAPEAVPDPAPEPAPDPEPVQSPESASSPGPASPGPMSPEAPESGRPPT
ncbi:DUF6191 domain-containing protein [Streptomyces sp. NPDC050528]|uniref:DUF6191 domain-containing protein n=1 Tax=unclassified Streptomyces TaxID=2593676 RepID=UPI0037BD24AD